MNTASVLKQHGIKQSSDVIGVAALVGIELSVAATLLEKESFGGENIYGADDVQTGGFYEKNGPVTQANFGLYKAHRKQNGLQGVGPTQLTSADFQDRADARGGCWKWEVNLTVGFEILQGYILVGGVRDAFRRYNGSVAYANDAMDKLQTWQLRLKGTSSRTPMSGRPLVKEGESGALVARLQRFLNKTFPLYSHLDLAAQRYGPETSRVIAEFQRRAGVSGDGVDPAGRLVGPPTWAKLEFFGFR